MKVLIKIGVIFLFSLISCKKNEVSNEEFLSAKGRVLEMYCSGTAVQLLNATESMGQNWASSIDGRDTVYKNVVLLNPFEGYSLIRKNIEFKYRKVDFFTHPTPICDFGIVGLDTLYQVYSFEIIP